MSERKPKSMRELRGQLLDLKYRYDSLDKELAELNRLILSDAVETAFNPMYERLGGLWGSQAEMVAAQMKDIRAEIDRITPSADVLKMLGEEFYFIYCDKYPVNKDTKLVLDYFQYPTWRYPILTEHRATFVADPFPPASFKVEYGEARFEDWSDGYRDFRLAYAADINTVFMHTFKRQS